NTPCLVATHQETVLVQPVACAMSHRIQEYGCGAAIVKSCVNFPFAQSLPSLLAALSVGFLSFAGLEIHAAPAERLGPSSRRTGLVISEIMYHPVPRPDGKNLEFIELYNSEAIPADLSGYRLSGDVDFIFPTNTVLPARSFLVVAPAPAEVQAVYGMSGVLGPFGNGTNSLSNDNGSIRLRNKTGAVLLEVHYSDTP